MLLLVSIRIGQPQRKVAFRREVQNLLGRLFLEDLEIVASEVRYKSAVLVLHREQHVHAGHVVDDATGVGGLRRPDWQRGGEAAFLGLGGGACWARVATNDRPAQVTMADRRKTTRFMDLPLFYLRRCEGWWRVQGCQSFGAHPWSRIGFVRGLLIVLLAAAAWAQTAPRPLRSFPADNEYPGDKGTRRNCWKPSAPGKWSWQRDHLWRRLPGIHRLSRGTRSDWQVASVIHGHFLSPTSNDAALSVLGCESHSMNFGGTVLLTRQPKKWKMLWYKPGVQTEQCHKVPLADRPRNPRVYWRVRRTGETFRPRCISKTC